MLTKKEPNMLNEKIVMLNEELDKTLVKQHPSSGFDYLEGYTVINTANKIFGYFGWSSMVQTELMREYKLPPSDKGTTRGMVMVPVTVEIYDGNTIISKSDVGTCVWNGEDQIETAIKGAATDGLKRAFRQFGKRFGNDLYEKDETAPTVGVAPGFQKQQNIANEFQMDATQKPPLCEKCGTPMALRKSSRGPFWGCSNYPNCKSIVNIDEVDRFGNRLDGSGPKNSPPQPQAPQPDIPQITPTPQEKPVDIEDVPF